MIHSPGGATVVVSPHLDDAVLSCYGILDSPGRQVVVVNLFTGVPPPGTLNLWDRVCGFDDSAEVAERRLHEDYAAMGSFSHVSAWYEPRLDSTNRNAVGDPEPGLHEIIATISRAVSRLADDRVARIIAPLCGSDRPNPDHVLARDAARALRWAAPVYLYADFPHVCKARGGWPADIFGDRAVPPDAIADGPPPRWVGRVQRDVPELDPLWVGNTDLLDDDRVTRKLLTASLYETQFGALDKRLRTKGLVSNRALIGVECVYPLADSHARDVAAMSRIPA